MNKTKGWDKRRGFTIVELLIVIVVIAVLAAISIIAYNGVQARSQDARMKAGVDQLEKAIYLWHVDKNQTLQGGWSSTTSVSGGNCNDGTGGWVASGTYVCAYEDVLISNGNLSAGFVRSLPANSGYGSYTDGRLSLMMYPCGGGNYALYWHLRNPSPNDAQSLAVVESEGCPTSPRTTYAMKAAKIIRL